MFCQNCGAELRLEEGFCPVCGAGRPRPVLRQESDERENKAQRLDTHSHKHNTSSRAAEASAGSSLLDPNPTRKAPPSDPRQIRSYQAIRQASGQRGSTRSLPPAASLEVPSSAPEPPAAPAEDPPTLLVAPDAPPAPANVLAAPASVPPPPAASSSYAPGNDTQAAPSSSQELVRVAMNGYHPADMAGPSAPITNGHAPTAPAGSYTATPAPVSVVVNAPLSGMYVPRDVPNRLALAALAGMFASFLLPWVIIGGTRTTPLSIGWPVLVPLAAILAVGATILLPGRVLYARFLLALPFAFGSFALGCALTVFLVSSAIAANTVGPAFLGVDVGFALFALAALALACAGYFKLLRELPLLAAGQIRLAPLPSTLGRLFASPAPRPPTPPAAP